jgi:hypothetical protein
MKKLFNFKKLQEGVTVVELLLYMGILTVLLTMLTNIFVSALDVQSESNATSSVEQDGNYILARLAYDIHRAVIIASPATNGQSADNFQLDIGGVYYRYSIDADNNLILTDITNNLGPYNLNSFGSGVSSFSVLRLGNAGGVEDSLKINFTITSRTKRVSGFETRDYQTNISLRRQ